MVGKGLMSLIAFGAQDIYLVDDMKFTIYYKKHIIENIIVGFEIYKVEFVKINSIKKCFSQSNIFDRNLQCINCEQMNLSLLPKFKSIDSFRKLTHFNCANNQITHIKKLIYNYNLLWLNCSYNHLISIPQKMYSLEYFDFSINFVKDYIDFYLYPNLKYLLCSNNYIKSISNLHEKLIYLDISNNPFEEIPNLPLGLEYLLMVQTKITKIDILELENLKYLDISLNNISSCLDKLPNGLIYLNCSQCNIEKINNLPFGLTHLICINNKIKYLDMLVDSLEYLNCDHNQITELNNLPNNLNELICSNNLITNLDNLPKYLNKLKCDKNEITILNNIPNNLNQLICSNNIIGNLNNFVKNYSDKDKVYTFNKFIINFTKLNTKKKKSINNFCIF